jgi:hypothetical protein
VRENYKGGLSLFCSEIVCLFTARQKDYILLERAGTFVFAVYEQSIVVVFLRNYNVLTGENSKYEIRRGNTGCVRELCTTTRQT